MSDELNPARADDLARRLTALADRAEPALSEDEVATIDEAADCIEQAAGIETGERTLQSPITGNTYRVTRWVEAENGGVLALDKRPIEDGDGG